MNDRTLSNSDFVEAQTKASGAEAALDVHTLLASPAPACVVRFWNQTPAGWNANIIGAVAEFTYDDGTTSRSVNTTLNMRAGDPPQELLSEPRCVKKVYFVTKIQVAGDPVIKISTATAVADPGKCQTLEEFYLGQAKSVAAEFFADTSKPLELFTA